MFKITIQQESLKNEEIFVYGKKSLLLELEESSILPNFNCRKGHCGVCIARLLDGQAKHKESIYPLSDGEILLCQTLPASDMIIAF